MSDYGIKMLDGTTLLPPIISSTEGQPDITCTNARFLRFSSSWNLFKQSATGTFQGTTPSFPVAGQAYTFSVNHNLGYAPAAILYWTLDGVNWQAAGGRYSPSFSPSCWVQYSTNATSINAIVIFNPSGTGTPSYTFTFRYSIYIDPAS